MPINFQDLSSGVSGLGGAVSDFATAGGDYASAAQYGNAAQIAGVNAQEAEAAGRLQTVANARSLYMNLGAASAASATNGLKISGSSADIIRSSQSQGALTQQMTQEKANIEANSYREQQTGLLGQEAQANAAGKGNTAGGIMSAVGSVIGIVAAFL